METIDILKLEFDKNAKLNETQLRALLTELETGIYTDLIVLSHGWNNDKSEALDLYDGLMKLIHKELVRRNPTGKKFLALGVIWPSKKFGNFNEGVAAGNNTGPYAGLAAQANLLSSLLESGEGQSELADIAGQLSAAADPLVLAESFHQLFGKLPFEKTQDILNEGQPDFGKDKLESMLQETENYDEITYGAGGAAAVDQDDDGGATSILGDMRDGIQNLLNLTTYYTMKALAGKIGRVGLHPVLKQIKDQTPKISLHLVGHSFGARLVSSALIDENSQVDFRVNSLSLLQAAFSHFAFAHKYKGNLDGLFRNIITNKLVTRSFIITHSRLDQAVGIAYALASRLAGQQAQAVGDSDDIYGGLGGNGAQKTPESQQINLLPIGKTYAFDPGTVYNLQSKQFIFGHSDIRKPEVAQALVSAFLT